MSLNPPQDYRKTAFTHRRGLLAARPAASDVLPGTLYYSTDFGFLDISDGVGWLTFSWAPPYGPNTIPETAIQDGAILARVADNEFITGLWTFTATGGPITLSSTGPFIRFVDTDSGVNMKRWKWLADANVLVFQTNDDVDAPGANYITFARSGVTPTLMTVASGISIAKDVRLPSRAGSTAFGTDQTAFNPTGLGSVFLVYVNATVASLNIRGILAQADGYTFSMYNVGGNAFNITFNDAAASAANRISTPGAVTISVPIQGSVVFHYDSSSSLWRIIARS